MTGFTALCARDISNILSCLAAMTFAMGWRPVCLIIITSHGDRDDMLNIPVLADLNLPAANVADARMRLE
jgi:hypothetical protein